MAGRKKETSAQDVIKKLTAQRDAFNKKARKFARKADKADAAIKQIEKVLALDMTLGEALKKAGFEGKGVQLEAEGGENYWLEAFKPTAGLPAATTVPKIKSGAKGTRKIKAPDFVKKTDLSNFPAAEKLDSPDTLGTPCVGGKGSKGRVQPKPKRK